MDLPSVREKEEIVFKILKAVEVVSKDHYSYSMLPDLLNNSAFEFTDAGTNLHFIFDRFIFIYLYVYAMCQCL